MRPPVGSTRPATMRRIVVLPQPDGPSSETNSPSAIVQRDVLHDHDARHRTCPDRSSVKALMRASPVPSARRFCPPPMRSARDFALPAPRPVGQCSWRLISGSRNQELLEGLAVGNDLRDLVGQLHLGVDRADDRRASEKHVWPSADSTWSMNLSASSRLRPCPWG